MPDNPPNATPRAFRLPDHRLLALSGRDAATFAQAQFMSDVASLAPGHWHWSGWLTPKGRVIALFALLKFDDETLWLLLPDFDAGELAAQLQRYVFRSKVALDLRDDLHANAAFASPSQASGATFARIGDAIELDIGGDGGPRTLRIEAAPAADEPESQSAWRAFDLAHGFPRLPESQREHWTPQQLSLERLQAFSVKKGCYPGQEIVARTHFLGQAKRGLMRLQGAGVGELDEVMVDEPVDRALAVVRPVGHVICAEANEGLAVMPLDAGDGRFSTGNQTCKRLPLLPGLAR